MGKANVVCVVVDRGRSGTASEQERQHFASTFYTRLLSLGKHDSQPYFIVKHCLSNRVVYVWNSLPNDIVSDRLSVSSFSRRTSVTVSALHLILK